MKKQIILLLFLLFNISFSKAQAWDSLGEGVPNQSPYLGVNALWVYNGNLYAGGTLMDVTSPGYIGYWNGRSWLPVGDGIINNYFQCAYCCINVPLVSALITFNGHLFAGGYFDSIQTGYAHAVAQWNGVSWDSVADGVSGASSLYPRGTYCADVSSFAIYNNELYMGGRFIYTGNNLQVNCVAKWNGTSWSSVGSGMNGFVDCLVVYNGNLYAGGNFDTAGGVPANNIAMWNGTQWTAIGSGTSGEVTCLCVYNNILYAGGTFDLAGGKKTNNIAMWNGSTWNPLGQAILPVQQGSGVFALTVYGSVLSVGGQFDTAGGSPANNIALWNGSTWGTLGSGVNGQVNALTTYNGNLIVGGVFDTAGGVSAINIAQWNSHLGIDNLNYTNKNIHVYPNPNNGQFIIQSSVASGQSTVLEIYNVLGEKIYNVTLKQVQGDYSINIGNQPAGVYLYRVLNAYGSLLGEGKLIVK